MPDSAASPSQHDPTIDVVIAEYLDAIHGGARPDRDKLLLQHPALASELREFFADQERFLQQVSPLQNAAAQLSSGDEPTLGVTSTPQPGKMIRYFGAYELLEEIGRGGMGVVYKARQVRLKRLVALKMIIAGQFAGEKDVQRFQAEAEAAAKLDHPGIVPIYEVGQHDGLHYFSMSLVDGESLAHRVARGLFEPREAARLLKQIAGAVAYAHAEGVIHRDLKPANVLVDRTGQPRITDFGLAKRVAAPESALTATGQVLGTPGYMPPEQASSDQAAIGPQADVYAIGATLYCLLTGRPPFQAASPVETLLQVMSSEPVSPRLLNAAVPRDLETIVLKCLEKHPSRRYESVQGFADELERYLAGQPILARPISPPARAWRWCQRNAAVATLLATVAVLLLVGTCLSSYLAVIANREAIRARRNELHAQHNANLAAEQALEADKQAKLADKRATEAQEQKVRADANALRFGRDLYVADLRLAQQAWNEGRTGRVLELLQGQLPEQTVGVDLRGFEWNYWNRLCHDELMKLQTLGANCVAYSPDGKRLAIGGTNYNLKIIDAESGKCVLDLRHKHQHEIWCVAFSPDGKWLASATGVFGLEGTSGEIKIWNTATGEEGIKLPGQPYSITSIQFRFDNQQLLTAAGDKTVRIWDLASGDEVWKLETPATVFSAAFSPDGQRVATASDGQPILGKPGEVKVWDVATKAELVACPGHTGRVQGVAFSPAGDLIAAGGGDSVRLWEAATGKLRFDKPVAASGVVFSGDGKRLAAGGSAVNVWDVATGNELVELKGAAAMCVSFHPDGNRLASADGWTVKVWDAHRSQAPVAPSISFDTWFNCTQFSPDSKRLAAGGFGPLSIRDAVTGQELLSIKVSEQSTLALRYSPDGQQIATAGEDQLVRIWDAATGEKLRTLEGHTTKVNGLAFSRDGKRLASVSGAGSNSPISPEIKVWEVKTGTPLASFTGNSRQITSVAFSPDGEQLAGGITQYGIQDPQGFQKEHVSGEVQVWNAHTGAPLFRLKHGHHVQAVAYSPDGTRLAGGGLSSPKIWDVATQRELCTLKGHTGDVNSLAFSLDGKRLASGSEDGSIRVWDAVTGQECLAFKFESDRVLGVAFSPDGNRLAAAGGRTLKIWTAEWSAPAEIGLDGEHREGLSQGR